MNGAGKRKKIYKRWTDWEEEKLISYLKRNRPIEKPNAQVYYTKFIEESDIHVDWNNILTKVKNMRVAYKKLKNRSKSRESCSTDQEESMQDIIAKRYPVFKDYQEIFGCLKDTDAADSSNDLRTMDLYNLDVDDFLNDDDSSQEKSILMTEFVDSKSRGDQKNCSCCRGLSNVLKIQTKLLAVHREIKEKEVKLKEDEIELQKEKLIFEKKKYAEWILRREKELKMERKLKIMGMRMKKEIALKNMEMKERLEMERLKLGELLNVFE